MFRNDDPTAVASAPADTAPTGSTPGYFTNGAPASGEPGTIVPDWWLNQIQEENMSILGAAEVTPEKGVNNQVLTSLNTLFGITNNLAARGTPGYFRLPGGILVQSFPTPQVNITSANSALAYEFTYPQPFPNFCAAIFGSDGGYAGTTWGAFSGTTKTGATGYVWCLSASGMVQGHILAIGA